jgi:signal transduction histidine kinase
MKENEQALINANATKDKFFNILAHDLRSPFSSILGFSKLLQENHKNYDTEQRVQLIKPIVDSTQKTFELLENLLEWARSQSGQITLNPDYYELQLLIDEIINIAEGAAKNKKVNLISAITEKISVYIDEEIVKTILRNLITNAIKFTPKGGTVNINAIQCNEIITVSISDTGVGISKEKQNSLFDLTKKTTTKGTNGETGSGLGLILCKEFVEKQDGNIWVESELGKGSTFYFTIPNKKCEY